MSEILLQTIVEKLESIQIASLKENNAGKDKEMHEALLKEVRLVQSEIKKLPSQFKASSERMGELLKGIRDLNFKLNNPLNEQIKYSHHLHKGIWISLGLFLISLLLLYGWINCYYVKNAFEANDIKYRYLIVNGNSNLLKTTYNTDSLYKLNKDYFVKKVVEKEKYFANQYEIYRIAGEKKKDSTARKVHIGR